MSSPGSNKRKKKDTEDIPGDPPPPRFQWLEKLEIPLEDKKTIIQVLKDKEEIIQNVTQEGERSLQQKDGLMQQKDQVIQQKDQVIQQKDQVIQQKDQVIQQKDQVIQDNIVQTRQQIHQVQTQSNRVIQQKDQLIHQVQTQSNRVIQQKDQVIQQKDQLIHDNIVQTRQQIHQVQTQLNRAEHGRNELELQQNRDQLLREEYEITWEKFILLSQFIICIIISIFWIPNLMVAELISQQFGPYGLKKINNALNSALFNIMNKIMNDQRLIQLTRIIRNIFHVIGVYIIIYYIYEKIKDKEVFKKWLSLLQKL